MCTPVQVSIPAGQAHTPLAPVCMGSTRGGRAEFACHGLLDPLAGKARQLASLQCTKACCMHESLSSRDRPNCLHATGCSPDAAQQLADEAGLVPPLLAKPLWADGRNGAHEIALLLDDDGLRQLCSGRAPSGVALPVTLQQYVPHGACLYKVRSMSRCVDNMLPCL